MTGYITGFSVYTLAMIGVIFIAFIVVKKSLAFMPNKNKNNFLKVENCLNIEPRKNLYVVKAGRERFLISSSGDNCQFMTKLHPEKFTSEDSLPLQNEKMLKQVQHDDFWQQDSSAEPQNDDFMRGDSSVAKLPQNDEIVQKVKLSKYFTGAF